MNRLTRWPLLLLVFLMGCPLEGDHSGPVETCETIAQQCRLGGGQLGVCSARAEGELFCMPQH